MKKYSIFILLLFSFLFFPKFVFALGQMTEPIVVENALRGEKIQKEIIAVNSDKNPIAVKFSAEGQIKDWAKFFLPEDLENSFVNTTIPAQNNLRVVVIINVPDDVLNGEYKGILSVTSVAGEKIESEESSAAVLQKIDREVTIIVSDHEEINLNTSIIPSTYDLEISEPLNVRIIYDNQGNVSLSPQIHLKIKKDDKNIYDVIYPYSEEEKAVNSKSQYEINPIKIQTIGWESGKYLAQLEFLHNNQVLSQKDFRFTIAQKDGLSVGGLDKFKEYWLYILAFVLLLIILAWQVKKNISIKRNLKKKQ